MPQDGEAGPTGLGCLAVFGWIVTAALVYGLALLFHWDSLTEGPRPPIICITGIGYWLVAGIIWAGLQTLTGRWRPTVGDVGICPDCQHPWRDHAGSRPRKDIDGYCRQCVTDQSHGVRAATQSLCRETFLGLPL